MPSTHSGQTNQHNASYTSHKNVLVDVGIQLIKMCVMVASFMSEKGPQKQNNLTRGVNI